MYFSEKCEKEKKKLLLHFVCIVHLGLNNKKTKQIEPKNLGLYLLKKTKDCYIEKSYRQMYVQYF